MPSMIFKLLNSCVVLTLPLFVRKFRNQQPLFHFSEQQLILYRHRRSSQLIKPII
uniref:Uncharacterized protein n=1 Tax=Rhizophora mucronata TaxID=61149 RepID=A0A2P2NPY2_RHIMU